MVAEIQDQCQQIQKNNQDYPSLFGHKPSLPLAQICCSHCGFLFHNTNENI